MGETVSVRGNFLGLCDATESNAIKHKITTIAALGEII